MPAHDRFQNYQRDQREFFDALIEEDWATYASEEWDELRLYEIEMLFARVTPRSVLDVGCGCGFHDQAMAEYDFVETVHGVDYSTKSIEKAEEVYPHRKVKRWVADLEADEPEEKYDLVVSFQVFEHLEDTDPYFNYSMQACEQDGMIAIIMPHRNRLPNLLRRLKGLPPVFLDPQHFHEYTFREVRKLAEEHGLMMVDSFGYGLNGLDFVNRMPLRKRLESGVRFPWMANGMCVLLRRQSAKG